MDNDLVENYAMIVRDPVAYVARIIGAKPQRWQKRVLRDLGNPSISRIAVKSCTGPGKTTIGAWAILWWLCRFPNPKIPCTAPTAHQLWDNLWPEINRWIVRSTFQLYRFISWTKQKVALKDPETGQDDPNWFAVGRVSRVSKRPRPR